jgi:hypothetical protein
MKPFDISSSIAVKYQTQIINADGSIAKTRAEKKNLILDRGLEALCNLNPLIDFFKYCVVGTGTTPTNRDSASTTASQSASATVTANANFFESADVGRLLKYDSGEEFYITGYIDPQTVTVDTSATVAASEFTIWYVNETTHEAGAKSSNSYTDGASGNGSTLSGSVLTHKRTFLFAVEAAPVTYREIGWSNNSGPAALLNGRDIIPGGGDSLAIGQRLKVIVQLILTINPSGPTPATVADVGNNGFNTAGQMAYGPIKRVWSILDSSGQLDSFGQGYGEPGSPYTGMKIKTSDFSLPTALSLNYAPEGDGTVIMGISGSTTKDGPTYYKDKTYKSDVNQNNSANIYGLYFADQAGRGGLQIKFTTPQEKDSDHELTFTIRQRMARALAN